MVIPQMINSTGGFLSFGVGNGEGHPKFGHTQMKKEKRPDSGVNDDT